MGTSSKPRKTRTNVLPGVKPHPLALARIREERGFTNRLQMAEFLGWDLQTYGLLEKGSRSLSFGEAIFLANKLGIPLEELLEDPTVVQVTPAKNTISDELQRLVRLLPAHMASPFYVILSALADQDKKDTD